MNIIFIQDELKNFIINELGFLNGTIENIQDWYLIYLPLNSDIIINDEIINNIEKIDF
jgi:hypothetical protein